MPAGPVDLFALSDFRTPWCLHVAATVRVADYLQDGPGRIDDLAARCGCDATYLGLVLRHLAASGVFEEPAPGRFALNDAARPLLEPAVRLGLDLDGIGGRMAHGWGTLLTLVRTGRPGYADVFGRPFWDDLGAHPAIGADFDALMGPRGHGAPDPDVLLDEDWAAVKTVVDVGGGTGAMLAAILQAHPHLTGTLVDLPATLARAEPELRQPDLASRTRLVGQSFFDPLPPGADLYLLVKVVGNWSDDPLHDLLVRCADAAGAEGRVVIVGGVAPPDAAAPQLTIETVLLGGMTRGLAAFTAIAARAGLDVRRHGRNRAGRFLVECRAAGR